MHPAQRAWQEVAPPPSKARKVPLGGGRRTLEYDGNLARQILDDDEVANIFTVMLLIRGCRHRRGLLCLPTMWRLNHSFQQISLRLKVRGGGGIMGSSRAKGSGASSHEFELTETSLNKYTEKHYTQA